MNMINTIPAEVAQDFDAVVVAFSGGKDSIAAVLRLIELGHRDNIILMHHDIDGDDALFDWAVTPAYCKAFAKAMNLPLIMSGRVGGFKAELNKQNEVSGDYWYQIPVEAAHILHGQFDISFARQTIPFKGKANTRRRFPAKAADLRTRWCSAFLKIDLGAVVLRQLFHNQERVLFVSGERREESSNRAKYAEVETHRTNAPSKRSVTHWRPVIDFTEADVWAIIEKHNVAPHPAYQIGWGRLSCMCCIFGSKDQWASVRAIAPKQFVEIAVMEMDFKHTIDNKKTVVEMANAGEVYEGCGNAELVDLATHNHFEARDIFPETWELPAGAFGESNGPS